MSNPARRPYLGEGVHYQAYGTPGGEYASTCRAAIITAVPTEEVPGLAAITVFNPTGIFHNQVHHDEERSPGTWHWASH